MININCCKKVVKFSYAQGYTYNIAIERREPEPRVDDDNLVKLQNTVERSTLKEKNVMGSLPKIIWHEHILLNVLLYVNMLKMKTQDSVYVMGCGLVIGLNFHVIRGNHVM